MRRSMGVIAGIHQHGYKGAADILGTIAVLLVWAGTGGMLEDAGLSGKSLQMGQAGFRQLKWLICGLWGRLRPTAERCGRYRLPTQTCTIFAFGH